MTSKQASLPAVDDTRIRERRICRSSSNDATPAAASDGPPSVAPAATTLLPSLMDLSDTSPAAASDGPRLCHWCSLEVRTTRPNARFCCRRCRQSAFRTRKLSRRQQLRGTPLKMAYADPPFPGKAWMYQDQPSFAGEVDSKRLLDRLTTAYDGWALSTGAYALREVLPLCPPGVRVCAWVKPIGVNSKTWGLHNAWEPLIVSPGRQLRPGKRDWLSAQPARGGGDLIGRKPVAFCVFLFEALGLLPHDQLDDLFPGSGIVARSWDEWKRAQLSLTGRGDVAPSEPSNN